MLPSLQLEQLEVTTLAFRLAPVARSSGVLCSAVGGQNQRMLLSPLAEDAQVEQKPIKYAWEILTFLTLHCPKSNPAMLPGPREAEI